MSPVPHPADPDSAAFEPALPAMDGDEPPWHDAETADERLADAGDADGDAAPGSTVAPAVSDGQLAAWIAAVVDHDERALAALYDASFARVFGLVRRIVRRPALAEEVVEDTYFQVWRQAARFDPARGSALAWLLGMARSRAIDALRREARFQHDPLDEHDAHAAAGDEAPADELLDLARRHAELHRALMRLGPNTRQLVSLAFFRGLSHEEIATQTRLPLGTVKSTIRRALLTLREVLGDGAAAPLAS